MLVLRTLTCLAVTCLWLCHARPYLSFVIASRRDDYLGGAADRLLNHVEVLLWQVDAHEAWDNVEIIIVEYNPGNLSLASLLSESLHGVSPRSHLRIITVPPSVHRKLGATTRGKAVCWRGDKECWHLNPFASFVSQNVGIRRAKGDFVLWWNPDDLLSPMLAAFLFSAAASRTLREDVFYVTGMRFDPFGGKDLTGDSPNEKLTQSVQRADGGMRTAYDVWGWRRPELSSCQPYTSGGSGFAPRLSWDLCLEGERPDAPLEDDDTCDNRAALHCSDVPIWTWFPGDFLLASKSLWERIGGLLEIPFMPSGLDTWALCKMAAAGAKQHVLLPPCFEVHQHHPRQSRTGTSLLQRENYSVEEARQPFVRKHELQQPPELWGFPGERFPEMELRWPG